jgi:hypothetical protein
MIRKKGTNGCLKGLKCRSEIGTLSGAVGRGGGWKPFGILNRRMAISFAISQIVTLGVHIAFSPYLFSFQASANDLASWYIAAFCINMCIFKSLLKLNSIWNNVFKEHGINSRKPLLLLLSPEIIHCFPQNTAICLYFPTVFVWGSFVLF